MIIRTTLSKWVMCSDLSFLLKMFFDSSRVAQFSAALDLFPKFCYIFYITEFEFLSIKITFEVIAVKRFAILLNFLLLIWLCGCSASPVIETLNNWSFQHNEGTNDYSVFFELRDKSGNSISADVDVDIRIVNDRDEEVFKGTSSVSPDDFGYYTSEAQGEQYLANIRIPASEITPGADSSGKVYLTVYKADVVAFDEVNCDAFYCLPIQDIKVESGPFPIELNVKGFNGSITSKIQIDDVTYEYEKGYTPTLTVTISGTKTYRNNNLYFTSGYDVISYKLYDSENYMVDSGSVHLNSLNQGDKFKDESIIVYDLIPGETYTLKLTEYEF